MEFITYIGVKHPAMREQRYGRQNGSKILVIYAKWYDLKTDCAKLKLRAINTKATPTMTKQLYTIYQQMR